MDRSLTYWEKFEILHGLIVGSGSTQDTIILNEDSYQNLSTELFISSMKYTPSKPPSDLCGVVTHYGPIKISVDSSGVDLNFITSTKSPFAKLKAFFNQDIEGQNFSEDVNKQFRDLRIYQSHNEKLKLYKMVYTKDDKPEEFTVIAVADTDVSAACGFARFAEEQFELYKTRLTLINVLSHTTE